MGGIERLAGAISSDLKGRLPGQRKTQREKLALLVATMLDVRRDNQDGNGATIRMRRYRRVRDAGRA